MPAMPAMPAMPLPFPFPCCGELYEFLQLGRHETAVDCNEVNHRDLF